MRTYITYVFLGAIGFIIAILSGLEFNALSSISKIILIVGGLITFPLLEYLINRNYHLQNKMKTMSKSELNDLVGLKQGKQIEDYKSSKLTKPSSFGYKTNWLAIKSNDIKQVLNQFSYSQKVLTDWETGVEATFEDKQLKFISPPINNWIFVIDNRSAYLTELKLKTKITELSKIFGNVQRFGSFRGTGYASWTKFKDGNEVRSFLIDDGDTFYNYGNLTDEEEKIIKERKEKLNLEDKEEREYYEKHNFINLLGDEDDVLLMAEKWSINPMTINEFDNMDFGYLIK